jgi:hypothetical protein
MDFPGGKVPFTPSLGFTGGERQAMPCYRVLDSTGVSVDGAQVPHALDKATAVKMYETMVALQAVDTIFYEAQRQVRAAMGAHARPAASNWPRRPLILAGWNAQRVGAQPWVAPPLLSPLRRAGFRST